MFGDAGLEYDDNKPATAPTTNGNGGEPHPTDDTTTPDEITWTPDAEHMLGKVPFFVRGRVRRNTEKFAEENGHHTITADVLQQAREALGG
jgi:light-independent protochlorophyllide reductase subunit B